ncbi:hypothetical protein ACLBWZ_05060 [Brucellaceae bacterium C25G]
MSIIALGAIVAVGAVSLWAVAQHKSPQTAISSLFRGTANTNRIVSQPQNTNQPTVKKAEAPDPARKTRLDERAPTRATATAPVPRPAVGLMPSKSVASAAPQPVSKPQVASNTVPVTKPNQMVAAITPPPAARQNLPPRGENRPDTTPSMVYAKQKLTVHKTAWDKSPSMGEVEKGRELRSYGQTGKWHRVVVPTTDMIGWVHEDMLVITKKTAGANGAMPTPLTTGSIKAEKATNALPFTAKTVTNHPVPQRSVGNQ